MMDYFSFILRCLGKGKGSVYFLIFQELVEQRKVLGRGDQIEVNFLSFGKIFSVVGIYFQYFFCEYFRIGYYGGFDFFVGIYEI